MLPEVIRRFTAAWPSVEIELRESHLDSELATGVERGELDLSFVQLPLDNRSLETVEVLRDDYVLVTAAGLAVRAPATAADAARDRRAAADRLPHCRSTDILVDQLRATGREPRFVFRSDENGVVQGLAGTGIGVAVIPRLAVDPNDAAMRIVDLGPKVAPRLIGIARHRDRYHSRRGLRPALDVETSGWRSA